MTLAMLLAVLLSLPVAIATSVLVFAAAFAMVVSLGQALRGLRRRHYRRLPEAWTLGHRDVPSGGGWLYRSQRRGPLHSAAVLRFERRQRPTIDWSLPPSA